MLTLLDIVVVVSPLTLSQQMKSEESGPVLGPGLALASAPARHRKKQNQVSTRKQLVWALNDFPLLSSFKSLTIP